MISVVDFHALMFYTVLYGRILSLGETMAAGMDSKKLPSAHWFLWISAEHAVVRAEVSPFKDGIDV